MKRHTNGLKNVGEILQDKNLENLIQRIGKNFENLSHKTSDPKEHRKFWWEQACKNLYPEEWAVKEERNKIFKKIMGQTSQFTVGELRFIVQSSLRKRIPRAYFWFLVKKRRAEIKAQLQSSK